MLQRVTATQQCVSTRCDLWWEKEIRAPLSLRPATCPLHWVWVISQSGPAELCSSSPCEREYAGGERLYYWRILCDVINCGAVTTIWYCDQRKPWHCSRVELPPCSRYQWLALRQQPACLFLQRPDWQHNGGCLPTPTTNHPPTWSSHSPVSKLHCKG